MLFRLFMNSFSFAVCFSDTTSGSISQEFTLGQNSCMYFHIDSFQTLAASHGSDHPLVVTELDDKHMSLA